LRCDERCVEVGPSPTKKPPPGGFFICARASCSADLQPRAAEQRVGDDDVVLAASPARGERAADDLGAVVLAAEMRADEMAQARRDAAREQLHCSRVAEMTVAAADSRLQRR